MTLTFQIFLIVVVLLFGAAVLRLVSKGMLQLKYALLWLFIVLLMLICACFPNVVSFFSHLVGIGLSSNFVFFVGLGCMVFIALSLSIIVSWEARDIRQLVQRCALMEKRLDELEGTDESKKANPEPFADVPVGLDDADEHR